jgi:hypothetical protein
VSNELLWMLDLDRDGLPWRAHLIVEDHGSARVTACGSRETVFSHPRGWWNTRAGEFPLAGTEAIHCGAEVVAQAAGKAE